MSCGCTLSTLCEYHKEQYEHFKQHLQKWSDEREKEKHGEGQE